MGKEPFYITTPIYYVNDVPHIGHAYTTIACDVLARFKRLAGYDVFFLTGTDEHGQKIERMALARGEKPKEYVDAIAGAFRALWSQLDISNDHFIRTTDPEHIRVVQQIFQKVYGSGDIYLGEYEGWYCTQCETFFLESQLSMGKCPDCGRAVEWLKEESYFFRLSKYQDRLLEHIEANPDFIQPVARRNEMVNFIKAGLEDLCVSRTTFEWGIPVPFDPRHVVYVWFDALTNYITAAGYLSDDERFRRYWPADVHVMGKEIVRFHSIIWPAMLMSMGLPVPKKVFGHGWWTVEGEKMSKSKGNVIKPAEYASEFGVDAVRYFVLREVPFGQDGDFSRTSFIHRTNADLANDLGNLLSRTTAMINKFADGRVPAPGESEEIDRRIPELAREVTLKYERAMDSLAFQDALAEIFRLVDAANKYIDDVAPWNLAKTDEGRRRLGTVLYNLAESLRIATIALCPVLTRASGEIWRQLGLSGRPEDAGWEGVKWGGFVPGTEVRRGDPVFPRLDTQALLTGAGTAGRATAGTPGEPTAQASAVKHARPEKPRKSDSQEKSGVASATPAQGGEGESTGDRDGLISIDEFARVDLRIATVVGAERVAGADKLLKLRVDLGDHTRQIVAGIAKHYEPDALVGRQIVVVANLEPAKLRGEVSQGMLLAASTNGEPRVLALLTPDAPIAPGSKVK
ncbi:MAG: methionine--tRNA ligase [Firmicutes bacterium]|jgi:methionyl-tRNA synthetase|nr:methionine--tRNA ligase [Bacillota bacterium]